MNDYRAMLKAIWSALDQPPSLLEHLSVEGVGELASVYAVTDLAVASISAATLSIAHLIGLHQDRVPPVRVDRVLASHWFSRSIQPQGWALPPTWDAIAGDYQTKDGWIKLHTNAPLHRIAALKALGFDPHDQSIERVRLARVIQSFDGRELEDEIISHGGCAAEMRSAQAWSQHPQGLAVMAEPLLSVKEFDSVSSLKRCSFNAARPLQGIRVLDLTRILAGPIATRYLASYGATVLRIDPLDWEEPVVAPEVTLGKKRARLDLKSLQGKKMFETLLAQADILVHGYRPDALEKLGFGESRRRELNPALIDICLDAYGWTGPWQTRRGFDSLVQMSSGIAHAGMVLQGKNIPTPLPVQALDHATGYMLAASAVRGLIGRSIHGGGSLVRASLARTAAMLNEYSPPRVRHSIALRRESEKDYFDALEQTPWGPARRLLPPYAIENIQASWGLSAGHLGDAQAQW